MVFSSLDQPKEISNEWLRHLAYLEVKSRRLEREARKRLNFPCKPCKRPIRTNWLSSMQNHLWWAWTSSYCLVLCVLCASNFFDSLFAKKRSPHRKLTSESDSSAKKRGGKNGKPGSHPIQFLNHFTIFLAMQNAMEGNATKKKEKLASQPN